MDKLVSFFEVQSPEEVRIHTQSAQGLHNIDLVIVLTVRMYSTAQYRSGNSAYCENAFYCFNF